MDMDEFAAGLVTHGENFQVHRIIYVHRDADIVMQCRLTSATPGF
jgi:hypothetical protein